MKCGGQRRAVGSDRVWGLGDEEAWDAWSDKVRAQQKSDLHSWHIGGPIPTEKHGRQPIITSIGPAQMSQKCFRHHVELLPRARAVCLRPLTQNSPCCLPLTPASARSSATLYLHNRNALTVDCSPAPRRCLRSRGVSEYSDVARGPCRGPLIISEGHDSSMDSSCGNPLRRPTVCGTLVFPLCSPTGYSRSSSMPPTPPRPSTHHAAELPEVALATSVPPQASHPHDEPDIGERIT